MASALAQLDSRWREDDVPRAERQALLQDVRADLVAAHTATGGQDVHDVADLLGSDPATFADEVVRERGVHRPRGRYSTVLVLAVVGALVALVIWPFFQTAISAATISPTDTATPASGSYVDADGNVTYIADPYTRGQWVVLFGGYVFMGVVAVALMVAGVHVALRNRVRAHATVWRAAVLIPVSVAVSLPTAIYYAGLTGYSTTLEVVLFECSLVLGGALLAVVIARWWALRRRTTVVA
ncbi:hypothetical protein [Kineococcus sp. GCM10028916]|uniref:hypothetical protein n=1 Tax=Kineococcus sp. GCM10028916 TaxID=3273394 RepID=UPI0036D327B2